MFRPRVTSAISDSDKQRSVNRLTFFHDSVRFSSVRGNTSWAGEASDGRIDSVEPIGITPDVCLVLKANVHGYLIM